MAKPPKVTVIEDDGIRRRFRIEGGEIRLDWAASLYPGRSAWCEFTVWGDDPRVSSYGGEVWLTAWPDYFTAMGDRVGGVVLTPTGVAACEAARGEVRS